MKSSAQGIAFVVVAVFGPDSVSETTWPTPLEAELQRNRLVALGVPADSIRIYQARVAKAAPRRP